MSLLTRSLRWIYYKSQILFSWSVSYTLCAIRSDDSTEIHCLVKSDPTGRFKRKIIAALERPFATESTRRAEHIRRVTGCLFDSSPACCTEVDLLDRGDRREGTGAILLTFTRYVLNFLEMAGPGKNRWRLLTSETCSSVIIEIPLFYRCIISGI